jgi:hypothetical protein
MQPLLIVTGFAILAWLAIRIAGLKRDRPFGFQPPKKTLREKISKLLQK